MKKEFPVIELQVSKQFLKSETPKKAKRHPLAVRRMRRYLGSTHYFCRTWQDLGFRRNIESLKY